MPSAATFTSMNSGILRRQTLDLDLAEDRLEDAARDDPRRLADEAEGHRHRQALGQVDLVEVGVQHLAADGVALHLAQQTILSCSSPSDPPPWTSRIRWEPSRCFSFSSNSSACTPIATVVRLGP